MKVHDDSDNIQDFWLVTLNADHEKIWDKTIGGDGGDYLAFATMTSERNIFLLADLLQIC